MRYLGNKTPLLGEIVEAARDLGFEGGTVCDLFAGSGAVGRKFRQLGCRVLSTDLMHCSWVLQKVFLECPGPPRFSALEDLWGSVEPLGDERLAAAEPADPAAWEVLLRMLRWLEEEAPESTGLLTRQYSPAGVEKRGYLTAENARRIDGILEMVRKWREEGTITEGESMLLLASVIDASDRVANISGTYGAYLKSWQPNALQPLQLRVPDVVSGPIGEANRKDALEWIAGVEADLLYIDPPYNQRQYPANYHLLDVIVRLLEEPDLEALEALERSIYGKTGLVPWQEQASPLCSRRRNDCHDAFATILEATTIPRVVISYNEEGIISREEFEAMLSSYSGVDFTRLKNPLREISHRRFRSDADGNIARTGAGRSYRQLEGRQTDEVHEWLFAVSRQEGRVR